MTTSRVRREPQLAPRASVRGASPTGYISDKLEGRLAPGKGGHSVYARAPIERGETLVAWGGEVVNGAQLRLLPPDVRHRLCLQIEEDLFLLTTREGPADWINHSCEPNAGLRGQIVLVALRDIEPGEEICFDYATCDSHDYCEFDCACGAEACRGRITAGDWELPELQERYRGFFSPYLERLIAERSAARERREAGYVRPAPRRDR